MTTGILASLAVSALWIILQITWMHIRPAEDRFGAMLRGFLVSLPVLAGVLYLDTVKSLHAENFTEPYGLAWFHAFLLHVLIFFCYVECFYHVERAVTFRMLIEISGYPDGIPVSELKKEYSLHGMVATRMDVLAEKKFVVRKGDHWQLTSKGRVLASLMHFTLWIYQAKSQRDREA